MTFPQETKCKKYNWGIEAIFKWTAYIDQSITKEKKRHTLTNFRNRPILQADYY
jgi:hypothetical protein